MVDNQKDTRDKARVLLDRFGGDVDDFFKLWPPDKQYFFSKDNQAFLAYAIRYKVAVCLGDPVGSPAAIRSLLKDFKLLCTSKKIVIVFIQASDAYQLEYRSIRLRSILIGSDAVVDLNSFTSETIRNKYFRNLVNRFDAQNYQFASYTPPHTKMLLTELQSVSNSWLTLPNHKEWNFLTGRFASEYLQQTVVHTLRNSKGLIEAFANEIPAYKSGVSTIDLMRYRPNAPSNCIDLLFIRLLQLKHSQGYRSFNLGISPLDGSYYAKSFFDKLLLRIYGLGENFIGFRGLHRFKAKYTSSWQPRYVWYQGSFPRLIQIGLAINSLMRLK